MEFSNLRVYQPDGTFKTGGLSISGDRIASAEVSADSVDMGGLYACLLYTSPSPRDA